MIDLHCHLLPGLDDGPADVASALAVARLQLQAGVQTVAVTPHVNDAFRNDADGIAAAADELRVALAEAGIPLQLVVGAEVDALRALELPAAALRRLRLGDTGPLLLEAPFASVSPLEQIVARLRADDHPILLAHPERSPLLQRDPELLARLVRMGVRTQVTARSFSGDFGRTVRRFAEQLADAGLVHVVASDAHDAGRRPPGLRGPLEETALGTVVARLCGEHPHTLLSGEPLPARVELPRRRGLTRLLRARR